MTLTPDEKKRIAEWMGWGHHQVFDFYCRHTADMMDAVIHFSLNDAGLCVKELVKQGKWDDFYLYYVTDYSGVDHMKNIIANLFTTTNGKATNFFRAMSDWIKKEQE